MKRRLRQISVAVLTLFLSALILLSSDRISLAQLGTGFLFLPRMIVGTASSPGAAGGAQSRSAVNRPSGKSKGGGSVISGVSYHNDTSPPLREIPPQPVVPQGGRGEREANANPKLPSHHRDSPDSVIQHQHVSTPSM